MRHVDKPIALTTLHHFFSFPKSVNLNTKGGHFETGQTGSIKRGLFSIVLLLKIIIVTV